MKGCMVLTAVEAEADEVLETARVVGKMSARKWRQVREFIGVIRERSEFCVTLKILQRHHVIQSPFKING